jgi:hypothetical protein
MNMRPKKFLGVMILLLFMSFLGSPLEAQTLSEVFISPTGNVLGSLSDFNPGFPAVTFVNGGGLLVWVEMEIPSALVEIYPDGYVRLIESGPYIEISYADGRISKIGDLPLEYDLNGRIRRIGGVRFHFEDGRLRKIGDISFDYDSNALVSKIGHLRFDYQDGRIRKVDGLPFQYDANGRVSKIGGVGFDYEYGTLKRVRGKIPGVALTVTSVVEFRKKL